MLNRNIPKDAKLALLAVACVLVVIIAWRYPAWIMEKEKEEEWRMKASMARSKLGTINKRLLALPVMDEKNASTLLLQDPYVFDPITHSEFQNHLSSDTMLIYSIGPDLIDQYGQIMYDPTNGSISNGDVTLSLSKGPTGWTSERSPRP